MPELSYDHNYGSWSGAVHKGASITHFFYCVRAAKWTSSHLAIRVRAFDCTRRIKLRHKLLSAKQVNNEDLDHQLWPQTLTALFTPLEPIDQGFHASSARLRGMINRQAQIPSYHWGSFVKVSLYHEKWDPYGDVSVDLTPCVLFLPLYVTFISRGDAKRKRQYCCFPMCTCTLFPHTLSFPLHSHHRWHSGQPMGNVCRYLLWLNKRTPAKSESVQWKKKVAVKVLHIKCVSVCWIQSASRHSAKWRKIAFESGSPSALIWAVLVSG